MWVVAACEGMVSLFEKNNDGSFAVRFHSDRTVFASLEQFKRFVDTAELMRQFDQLVVVGGSGDIAWVHSSLSEAAAHRIAAEIRYPLLPTWFKEPAPMPHLSQVLQGVLS